MIKISVIIPVYNTEPYLKRCFDSVCNQTLKDIEIICINDGSTDNSLEILREYEKKDDRVKVINFEQNKGVSIARNAGIDAARGEYIGFVDSDDYPEADFYEKLYNVAVRQDADIVKGNYKYEDGYIDYSVNAKIREYKTNFCNTFCSGIYRTKLIVSHKIQFPADLTDMEDPVFVFYASFAANKVETVDDAHIVIIRRPGSATVGVPNRKAIISKFQGLRLLLKATNNSKVEKNSYLFVNSFWFYWQAKAAFKNPACRKYVIRQMQICFAMIKDIYKMDFQDELVKIYGCDPTRMDDGFDHEIKMFFSIPVCLSSDDNYAPFLAVTIASICYNTVCDVRFYVLDGGISNFRKKQIEGLKEKFSNFTIQFVDVDPSEVFSSIDYQNMGKYISIATYNRFLIPQAFPYLNRALYLDVDLIVLGDIAELYAQNLNGRLLGAVPCDLVNRKSVCMADSHVYFNAGVLLINCESWRKENITEKLFEAEKQYRSQLIYADQCVLNKYFENNYQILDKKYNVSKMPGESGTFIRHFVGPEKPWNTYMVNNKPLISFNEFWFFASLTPFYAGLQLSFTAEIASRKSCQEPVSDDRNAMLLKVLRNKIRNSNIRHETPLPIPLPPSSETKQWPLPIENFMDVKITYACNLKCEYCYQSDVLTGERPQHRMLSQKGAENFIKFVNRFKDKFSITLAGGEPFVYPHLLYLCENLNTLGHRVNLVTNFSLPFENMLPIIHLLAKSKGVINISVHLSQWRNVHDFYFKLIKLIEFKKENDYNDFTILLTCVVTEDNFANVKKLKKYIEKNIHLPLELQRVYHRNGDYFTYPQEIEDEVKKWGGFDVPVEVGNKAIFTGYPCWCGSKFFYIEAEGQVYRCYGKFDDGRQLKLGNLAEPDKITVYDQPLTCTIKNDCICYKHFIRQKFIVGGTKRLNELIKKESLEV